MEKRGLTHIVTALILVLFAIVVIIIVWNITKSVLQKEGEIAEAKTRLFSERMEIVTVDLQNFPAGIISIVKTSGELVLVGEEVIETPPPEVDFVSVVDLSGSMSLNLQELKNAHIGTDEQEGMIDTILSYENNMLGLAPFSNIDLYFSLGHSLSDDSFSLKSEVQNWSVGGNTCICCGINRAIQIFNDAISSSQSPADKKKAMIVMSDGTANVCCSGSCTVANAIEQAKLKACEANETLENLVIYSVGYGSEEQIDEATLEAIAECGGGSYYYANVGSILQIYQSIIQQVQEFGLIQISNYLLVVFYSGAETHTEKFTNLPDKVYETKNYDFILPNGFGEVDKIEIYPVVVTPSGDEVIGGVLDVWKPVN